MKRIVTRFASANCNRWMRNLFRLTGDPRGRASYADGGFVELTYKYIASIGAAALILSLSAFPAAAGQGPFIHWTGSWSGSGNIILSSGSRERIRCRATYDALADGNSLQLTLRCASDSYNFDFRGNAYYSGGNITGDWSEKTKQVAGQFFGRVAGNHVDARAEGQTFAALLGMTTYGDTQSISIWSPGSQLSEVTIALSRR